MYERWVRWTLSNHHPFCDFVFMALNMTSQITRRAHLGLALAFTAAFVLTGHRSGRDAVHAQGGCGSPANDVVANVVAQVVSYFLGASRNRYSARKP